MSENRRIAKLVMYSELLADWLHMPEGTTIRLVSQTEPERVNILIEHDDFDVVPDGQDPPIVSMVFQSDEDGNVRFVSWD